MAGTANLNINHSCFREKALLRSTIPRMKLKITMNNVCQQSHKQLLKQLMLTYLYLLYNVKQRINKISSILYNHIMYECYGERENHYM